MITIGGQSHRWLGKQIRTISYKDMRCASMPRKESFVSAKCSINPGAYYEVDVIACGNGKIKIGFGDGPYETVFIAAADFSIFTIYIDAKGIDDPNQRIVCRRDQDKFSNIYLHQITLKEVDRPKTKEEIVREAIEEKQKKILEKQNEKLEKQKEISAEHNKKDQEYREKYNEHLMISRGEKMGSPVMIGGNGYRWKGKNIKSIVKSGKTHVMLSKTGSIVLIPVDISPNAWFEIEINGHGVKKGNGNILVNFFAGKKYDGSQKLISIIGENNSNYTFDIQAPNFPRNTPIYLRVWRPLNSIGKVFIKDIKITQIEDKPPPVRVPKLAKAHRPPKKLEKTVLTPKEDTEMKFKPYEFNEKRAADGVKHVLVNNASMVPKVSIITPTRDGLPLLRKCYKALNENTSYPNWEWIVGDSDSTDGTIDYLKNIKDSRVKLIERGTTDGSFSSINNELAEFATGEYYLFLNNDTEPQKFWLYEMMSKIYRSDDVGIVGARLMYNESQLQHAGIMFIPQGPINVGKDVIGSLGGEPFVKKDRFLQAVTGACLLIRAEDFKKVKGFDPIYYFCYEDVDLCLKVKYNLGKKILYAANSIVMHDESVTQKKHSTHGDLQRKGIQVFKDRWINNKRVELDFMQFCKNQNRNIKNIDISFVTCVNNLTQYNNYVVGSLFKTESNKNYEIVPVLNFGNPYSAAEALNIGINQSRGSIIVLCHQDILFYRGWIDMLYERIAQIEEKDKNWGVLGTAGITEKKDSTIGVVHNIRGSLQWQQTIKAKIWPVQTVDEHCMIIKKNSNLKFDHSTFNGFHCYGPDICLNALSKGMKNYGILCPLVHDSMSGSLISGREEFMRLLNALANKWRHKFPIIRTTTSKITGKRVRTFIRFR